MGLSQRRKGRGWEQQVARDLREYMPGADIRRGWQSRKGSDDADVICPLYWIECKCGKQPSPRAALRQAQAASPGGKWILAVIKDDRKEPFAVLSHADLHDILREIEERDGSISGAHLTTHGVQPDLRKALREAGEIRLPGKITVVHSPDEGIVALPWCDMLRIIGEHWRVANK